MSFDESTYFHPLATQLDNPLEITEIRRPGPSAPQLTAVATILRTGADGIEVLLIKRSERDDDPWSGHIALPGGRAEPSDATLAETAARETLEEINLQLEPPRAILLGALGSLAPRIHRAPYVSVQPLVWAISDQHHAFHSTGADLGSSAEVDAAQWTPIHQLTDPHRRVIHSIVGPDGNAITLPGIQIDLGLLWGLTLRICEDLIERLDRANPQ